MKTGQVQIQLKSEPKDLSPNELLHLVPYRVVLVGPEFKEVEVGDVVLKFPCSRACHRYILNCTRNDMLVHNSQFADFKCRRAHDVQSVTFSYDDEIKP